MVFKKPGRKAAHVNFSVNERSWSEDDKKTFFLGEVDKMGEIIGTGKVKETRDSFDGVPLDVARVKRCKIGG